MEAVPSIVRLLGASALVLGLLMGTLWLLKRGAGGKRSRGFAVEAALPLGERRSLAIVTVEGRRLLLGLAPNHVSLVTELDRTPFDQAVADAGARSTGGSAPEARP